MMFRARCACVGCLLIALPAAVASQRPAEAVRQEREQAAREGPRLADTLALKPGGRLAVMDFPPEPGSKVPAGVPADRGGHGIPPSIIVTEVTGAGFKHLETMTRWPPDDNHGRLFLVLFEKP